MMLASAGAPPSRWLLWRNGQAAAALAGVVLLAGGCASRPSGPEVASVPTANSSASQAAGKPAATDMVEYAKCMRANGITNFPDPGADGGIELNSGDGLDPNSPQFKAAQEACKSLQPGGGTPQDPAQAEEIQQKFLAFAKCMRENGIADYPDPKPKADGGIDLQLPEGVDVDSPQFKAAQEACESLQPGNGPSVSGGGS